MRYLSVLFILLAGVVQAREYSIGQIVGAKYGASAKLCVMVYGEDGTVVSNALVECGFSRPSGCDVIVRTETDYEGVCILEGKTNGECIWIKVKKDGYYNSQRQLCFVEQNNIREISFNRWQPYGEKIVIKLRKVNSPIKMSSPRGMVEHVVPWTNDWLGYDLSACDFVEPYGRGKIRDLEIRYDWDGRLEWLCADVDFKIRFVGANNGYYLVDKNNYSSFCGSYRANINCVFQSSIEYWSRIVRDDKGMFLTSTSKLFDADKEMIARVRVVNDTTGKILQANYVRISDLRFGCYDGGRVSIGIICDFNPTPNDTNLEPL